MKTTVDIGKGYALRSGMGGVVTDANGTVLKTLQPNEQAHMTAQETEWIVPDDCKVTKITFNGALIVQEGGGGGGESDGGSSLVPPGFIQLSFLESDTQAQFAYEMIMPTGISESIGVKYKVWQNSDSFMVLAGNMNNEANTDTFYPLISYKSCLGVNINGSKYLKTDGSYESKGANMTDSNGYVVRGAILDGEVNWLANNKLVFKTESFTETRELPESIPVSNRSFYVGTQGYISINNYIGRLYNFAMSAINQVIHYCVPTITDEGNVCLFDTITQKVIRNNGTKKHIAGFTLAQARNLGNLPAGTNITVALPSGWDSDEKVVQAKMVAESKGCVIAVRDYDAGDGEVSAAAAWSLRRIWVRRSRDDSGNYVDAANTRWHIDWCVDVIGASPESLGYEQFRSVEVAADYWELTPIEPEIEQ